MRKTELNKINISKNSNNKVQAKTAQYTLFAVDNFNKKILPEYDVD